MIAQYSPVVKLSARLLQIRQSTWRSCNVSEHIIMHTWRLFRLWGSNVARIRRGCNSV